MGTSLAFLVHHFLHHPEHRYLLYQQIAHNPQLAQRFEALQEDPKEEEWLEWFSLLEHVSPSFTQILMQEVSQLLYGSMPDLAAFTEESQGEVTFVEENQSIPELTGLRDLESEAHFPTQEKDKTERAMHNSKLVYMTGPGEKQFTFDIRTGELSPYTEHKQGLLTLRCKLELKKDKLIMKELELTFSEHRSLSYRGHKWYWNNTRQIDHAIRMDIKDISRVLQADVVDLLLDLVSPGLIYQGTDMYLSMSAQPSSDIQLHNSAPLSSSIGSMTLPSAAPSPSIQIDMILGAEVAHTEVKHTKINPADIPLNKPLPSDSSFLSSGEKVALTRSPFAFNPETPTEGETTQSRRAMIETKQKSRQPEPKELFIEYIAASPRGIKSWFSKAPSPVEVARLTINQTHIIQDLGIQLTFLVETTADTMFPWVRVNRSVKFNTEATVQLEWNHDHTQTLPPGCISTGALSRNPVLGRLHMTIQAPKQGQQHLHISWLP